MTLRLLSSGVDSLYLSARGGARAALLGELEAARVQAGHEREPVPFDLGVSGWRMLLKPGGWGGYAYWLTSPSAELWLGRGKEESGPAVRMQVHSAFLHAAGARGALAAVRALLTQDVCAGPPMLSVSRMDVYADAQGWRLSPSDLSRFVTRANHRRSNMVGQRFTGFEFGRRRARVKARLYDKQAEMDEQGLTWMHEVWRGREEGEPVWRLEFELRRKFMRRLEAQEPEAVLDRVPALWRYCIESWLSLRTPSAHAVTARWPVDPMWLDAYGLLGDVQAGRELVWQAVEAASELRALRGGLGYLIAWAAMWGIDDLDEAAAALAQRAKRFLAGKDRKFATEVARKRAQLEVRGVRYDGLDGGRNVRLGHGGPRWRALSDRPKGRKRAVRRSNNQQTPKGGDAR